MKRLRAYLFLVFLLPVISGCWFIVGGAVGAAGAYVVGKDYVQGETDQPYEAIWDAALMVAKIRGNIEEEDSRSGYIKLKSADGFVWIKLIRLTHATTRLKVAARKFHVPNISLAQDIYLKILEEAK